MAVTLVLGTDLLAARVKDTFGGGGAGSGLYYAPSSTFSESINLLTLYDQLLADKIGPEFYCPSFLKPRKEHCITVPVANLAPVSNLPKMSPAVLKYAMVPGTGNANVFTAQKLNHTYAPSASSVKCEQACGTCKTASPQDFHPRDTQIIEAAENKLKKKTVAAPCPAPSTAQEKVKVVTSLASRTACAPAVVSVAKPEQGRVEPTPESKPQAPAPALAPALVSAPASTPAPLCRPLHRGQTY